VIPSRLLPHSLTLIRPLTGTNPYGDPFADYGPGATRTTIYARLEQAPGREVSADGATTQIADWTLVTAHLDVTGRDRVEFNGDTFEVIGPAALSYDSAGRPHHVTASMRVVNG
jgi:head-tail adaptor